MIKFLHGIIPFFCYLDIHFSIVATFSSTVVQLPTQLNFCCCCFILNNFKRWRISSEHNTTLENRASEMNLNWNLSEISFLHQIKVNIETSVLFIHDISFDVTTTCDARVREHFAYLPYMYLCCCRFDIGGKRDE